MQIAINLQNKKFQLHVEQIAVKDYPYQRIIAVTL